MNSEMYMNELTRLLEEIGRFFKLYQGKNISPTQPMASNNLQIIKDMADSELNIFSELSKKVQKKEDRERIDTILSGIKLFADAASVENLNISEMDKGYKLLMNLKETYEQEKSKNELIKQVFQSDLEEMRLHDNKLKTLQELVDMDIKLHGKVNSQTLDILDVQHCTLNDNLVEDKDDLKEMQMQMDMMKQKEPEKQKNQEKKEDKKIRRRPSRSGAEKSYQGSAYLKGDGTKQTPLILYGSSPEAIITRLQGFNMNRTEDMKLVSCYIRKLNIETNKYENAVKYDVSTGEEITPIYLNLPHVSKDRYLKIVEEIKKNGAKYNPVKKAFFITKQNDLNAFSKYLPINGTHSEQGENRSRNELSYEIESGQEYYDNRVKVTIEGREPFNVYGDEHGVHFPSLSMEQTREIIEKFVLPDLDTKLAVKEVPQEIEYDGKKYDPLQYEVIQLAERQNFTKEQMELLKHPELTSDRMNEIRFAIRDGLSIEQISQFATPGHELWQMDFCRIGMQHNLKYEELKEVINPEGYSPSKWGERRSMINQIIKTKESTREADLTSNLPQTSAKNCLGKRESIMTKLSENKAKLDSSKDTNTGIKEKHSIER
ncbi:MAG: hypothetical protein PUC12_02995 [Clostridiales bacterium]|nr:hypothetical protein [Clostridiales bacterium]